MDSTGFRLLERPGKGAGGKAAALACGGIKEVWFLLDAVLDAKAALARNFTSKLELSTTGYIEAICEHDDKNPKPEIY